MIRELFSRRLYEDSANIFAELVYRFQAANSVEKNVSKRTYRRCLLNADYL